MLELKNQKLLIIAPHPDDEILGCGGLIKRVKDEGGKVYILFLTIGTTNDYSKTGVSTQDERMLEIEKVAKYLKYDDYRIAFPGNHFHLRLDQLAQKDLMAEIENGSRISLNRIKPTIIATPPPNDYNQDHRAATSAVFAAARPAPSEFKTFQNIILGYESVPTATWAEISTQNPNFFVSLTEKEMEAKLIALKLYKSQVRTGRHPRSLESVRMLARYRGMQSGNQQAEAFYSHRIVIS